jgi:hypothetical protein
MLDWQQEFIHSRCKIKVLYGAADTGKSWVSQYHLIRQCLTMPGSKHIACATTYMQSYRAIVEPMKQFLTELGVYFLFVELKSEGVLLFHNGSRIEVIGEMDLEKRLHSREVVSILLEEAAIFKEAHIEGLVGQSLKRCRQKGYPDDQHHLIMVMNPGLKSQWLYEYLVANPPPPEDAWIKQLKFKDGYNRNDKERAKLILMGSKRSIGIYYHGEWGNLEGMCFPLEIGKHVREISPDEYDQCHITFDYGQFPDPMVFLLTAEKNGVIFVLDEVVLYDIDPNRHEAYIEPWKQSYNIVGFTGDISSGSPYTRTMLLNWGIEYQPTSKKRHLGWTLLSDLHDLGRLIIHPRCKYTRKSLESMCWVGSTKGIDADGEFDDPADALRYFVMVHERKLRLMQIAQSRGIQHGSETIRSTSNEQGEASSRRLHSNPRRGRFIID